MTKLTDLKNHQTGIITKINGVPHFQSRIVSIGLTPASKVEILQNSSKQPILLYCKDTVIALSKSECDDIEVQVIDEK